MLLLQYVIPLLAAMSFVACRTIADESPVTGGVSWTLSNGKASWKKGDQSAFVSGTFGSATTSGYYTPKGETPAKMAESYDGELMGSGYWILNNDGTYTVTMAEIQGSNWGPTVTNGTFRIDKGCNGKEKQFQLSGAKTLIGQQGQTLIPVSGTVYLSSAENTGENLFHDYGIFAPSFHCQIPFNSIPNLPRNEEFSGNGRVCTSDEGSGFSVMGNFTGSNWGPLFCSGQYTQVSEETYNRIVGGQG